MFNAMSLKFSTSNLSSPPVTYRNHFFMVILVMALFSFNEQGSAQPQSLPFSNSHFATVEGMKLHYRIWEPVQPNPALPWVFMVHGMGASTWSWEENAPALTSKGFTVVAADVPPFGFSDKNPDFNQSPQSRGRLFLDLISLVNPGAKWHLVGHSMGGGIVQAMAILDPERFERVVFVAPALFITPTAMAPRGAGLLRFRPFEWIAAGVGKITLVRPAKIRELLVSAYGTEPDPADVAEYHRALSQPGFARAFIRASAGSPAGDPLDGSRFDRVALAIWGDRDTWVPYARMTPTLKKLPTVESVLFEGAGHCPMNTHTLRFNNTITDFLLTSQY